MSTGPRDLENIFGRASIWGEKTNEGYSEVRFAGVEPDGTIVLFRRDLHIETDETTLTRRGLGVATTNTHSSATSTGQATVVGNTATGSATTTGSANSTTLYMQPRTATTIAVPSGTFPIRVPPGTTDVPFENVTIRIIRADPVSLTYRIVG